MNRFIGSTRQSNRPKVFFQFLCDLEVTLMHLINNLSVSAKCLFGKIFLTALLATSAMSASGANLAVNFGDAAGSVSSSVNVGWQFSIASPISVSQLGIWDSGGDGLGESHPIAIWSSIGAGDLGSALVSATIPAGTGTPLAPGTEFRMVDVTPTLLPAGSYVVGARFPGNQVDSFNDGDGTGLVFGAGIDFIQKRFAGSLSFERPDNTDEGVGIWGPNFAFTPVPEPSSMAAFRTGSGRPGGLGLATEADALNQATAISGPVRYLPRRTGPFFVSNSKRF